MNFAILPPEPGKRGKVGERFYVEHSGQDGLGVPKPCVGHCGTIEHAGLPQRANWPESCRREITVSYAIDQIPADLWRESLQRALCLWEQAIDVRFLLLPNFTRQSRIWITDAPLPGSTLAWSFLADNSCQTRLEQRYDTLVDWSHDYLTATIGHEVGHALGLRHSDDRLDLLYPSITMNTVGPSRGDIRQAVRLGYAEQTDPPEPDPDPPTDPEPEPPPMDWIAIVEIILTVLKECQENSSRDATRALLKRGGLRVALPLRRALRKKGLKGQELREAVKQGLADLAAASDAEIDGLLDDSMGGEEAC